MQPVYWLTQCGEIGGGVGELRANIIVATEPLLLDAHIALFVTVIDARHAANRQQHRHRQRRFGRAYLRGDARHIMIADERLWHEGIQERIMPLEIPIQLKEVLRLQRMLNRRPQLILRV